MSTYSDGRPGCRRRMPVHDHGVVLRHGDGWDGLGAREASVAVEDGVFHLFYDGAGPTGWLACLATGTDLMQWTKHGPVLDLGPPGADDSATASSPWVVRGDEGWHMFYVGSPNATPPPGRIPAFPYLTCTATADRLAGPWRKDPERKPFRPEPGTYYADTASPGAVIKDDGEFLQFFSASAGAERPLRTLGLARTRELSAPWQIDPEPILPPAEQIENSSLYYEPANRTWFLFTNHVGIDDRGAEFTDAIWVYWSRDPRSWNPDDKAVVLDGSSCSWSSRCVGMPSVIAYGGRLALLYDAPGGDSIDHLRRDLGLAWLDLPLAVPD
ncbi:hypothetical protein [Microlunatus speluncae]|uniref:hypothetical protein n=1 Tax=Microlunatus speluncae TaxID=2594267 RepID=UPI0012661A35|nr:hypothetical protein [Microlunatus speluncae]